MRVVHDKVPVFFGFFHRRTQSVKKKLLNSDRLCIGFVCKSNQTRSYVFEKLHRTFTKQISEQTSDGGSTQELYNLGSAPSIVRDWHYVHHRPRQSLLYHRAKL